MTERMMKWPDALVGALAYGAGMAVGALVTVLLTAINLGSFLLSFLGENQPFLRLLFGIVFLVVVFGLVGGIGGWIGGYILSRKLEVSNPRRFTWRSGWSLFVPTAGLILPVIIITAFVGFLNNDLELSVGKLPTMFAVYGLIFGIIAGLLFGLLITGVRRMLGVLLASAAGFAVGGWFLGLGLHMLLRLGETGGLVVSLAALLALFLFGAFGGGGIGLAFHYVDRERTLLPPTRGWRIVRNVVLIVIGIILLSAVGKLIETLTVRQPDLATVLPLKTVTTHWNFSESGVPAGSGASTPAIATAPDGTVTLAWVQTGADQAGVYFAQLPAGAHADTPWSAATLVADSPPPTGASPSVAVNEAGSVHIVWAAAESNTAGETLQYSRCADAACEEPVSLSALAAAACPASDGSAEGRSGYAAAADSTGDLLVAWSAGDIVPYVRVAGDAEADDFQVDCLPLPEELSRPGSITLSSDAADGFVLAFSAEDADGEPVVVEWRYEAGSWENRPVLVGSGSGPSLFVDKAGRRHLAWCSETGSVNYLSPAGDVSSTEFPPCEGRPALGSDAEGRMHVVWSSDQVRRATGDVVGGNFLYETILAGTEWTEPAIIAQPEVGAEAVLAPSGADRLHLAWTDSVGMAYGHFEPYTCTEPPATAIGRVIYEVVRQEKFRPADDVVPYCHNHFERLLFTPNPASPEIVQPDNPNAAFDDVADLVRAARYEALFATMQWDAPNENGGPGATLAQAIAELYENVKAHPEQYPRGMTVRILLGNVPELAIFEPTTQVYHVFEDLHDAGVTEMRNDEIGWRLEIADYGGAWPHMHSKFAVADGREVLAGGFNFGFLHLPIDHPSGLGYDMSDKGVEMRGPIAQSVLAAYDDLWQGSDLITCSVFPPPIPILDFLWCDEGATPTDHPPEVLRFADNEGESIGFALHHTSKFLESDEAILAAIDNAGETIDLAEVNFSLDTICLAATLLADLCTSTDLVPPYMTALLEAVEENDIQVRIIVEPSAVNGFENRIGIKWLFGELDKIGKRDNVEIRFYDGKMHDKSLLVDNEFLIVGSQNFHYSAWGSTSLTEYNIATEAPDAVSEFKAEYEYHWEQGIPVEEKMILP